MSNFTNEVDDWENSEVKLDALNLNDMKPKVSAPVSILPRSSVPFIERPQNTPSPVPQPVEETIDSALLSAIDNPRERMILFQIEDTILRFVKSSERTMELPAGLNSFRRLLAYRIGQRFGLIHTTSDAYDSTGEKVITLHKTATSAIPKPLLIDLKTNTNASDSTKAPSIAATSSRTGTNTGDLSPTIMSGSSGNNTPTTSGNAAVTPTDPPKKMIVMKRRPNAMASDSSKNNTGNKPSISNEEREKAYLEARARIFGTEAAATDTTVSTPAGSETEVPVTPTGSEKVTSSSTKGKNPTNGGRNTPSSSATNTGNSSPVNTPAGNHTATTNTANTLSIKTSPEKDDVGTVNEVGESQGSAKYTTTSTSSKSGTGNNSSRTGTGGKVIDVTAWKGTRSQLKDVESEKTDPDFVRRSMPPTTPSTANTGTNGGNLTPSGYPQHQQPPPPPQQQHAMNAMMSPMTAVGGVGGGTYVYGPYGYTLVNPATAAAAAAVGAVGAANSGAMYAGNAYYDTTGMMSPYHQQYPALGTVTTATVTASPAVTAAAVPTATNSRGIPLAPALSGLPPGQSQPMSSYYYPSTVDMWGQQAAHGTVPPPPQLHTPVDYHHHQVYQQQQQQQGSYNLAGGSHSGRYYTNNHTNTNTNANNRQQQQKTDFPPLS